MSKFSPSNLMFFSFVLETLLSFGQYALWYASVECNNIWVRCCATGRYAWWAVYSGRHDDPITGMQARHGISSCSEMSSTEKKCISEPPNHVCGKWNGMDISSQRHMYQPLTTVCSYAGTILNLRDYSDWPCAKMFIFKGSNFLFTILLERIENPLLYRMARNSLK